MTNPKITSNNGVFVPPLSVDAEKKARQKNDMAGLPENPGTSKMDAQQAKKREAAKRQQLLRSYPEWGHLYDGSAENSSSTNLKKPLIAETSDENSAIHKSGFYDDDDWTLKIRDRLKSVSSQILDRKEKDTSQPAGSSKFDFSAFSQTLLHLNSSRSTNVLQSQPGFPDVPINKASLKSFCANLRKEGVDADALQELKDVIDGKKDVTEAAIFGKLTNSAATKKGKGKSTDPAELLVSSYVATQLASCFKSSYPWTADSRRRDLGRALILKLIEISCKNSTSKDTEWLELLPELEFWSKAESSLQKWMPKEDIVATREKFLSEMRDWKDKEQHIDNIAEMCICESRAIYDAFDEKIKTLDHLIDQYTSTLDSKEKVGGVPDDKDVEGLRSYIDELVTGIGLDKLSPWSVNGPKQAGMLKTYEEKTEAIREAFKGDWKKDWNNAASESIYQTLNGWTKELIDETKALKLDVLTPPDKKTKFIDDAAKEGMNFRRVLNLNKALIAADRQATSIAKFGTDDAIKLSEQDAVKIREWTSSYLGAAVEHLKKSY